MISAAAEAVQNVTNLLMLIGHETYTFFIKIDYRDRSFGWHRTMLEMGQDDLIDCSTDVVDPPQSFSHHIRCARGNR